MKHKALTALTLLIALSTVFVSISYAEAPSTADYFGDFYGKSWYTAALAGYTDTSHPSCQVGNVVYTMGDVIITAISKKPEQSPMVNDGQCSYVLATMTISPAEGMVLPLIPSNGYATTKLWGNDEDFFYPYATPASSQDGQAQAGTRVWAHIKGLLDHNGDLIPGSVGYVQQKQADGSILTSLEFMLEKPIDPQETYEISVHIANWEVTPEGEALWEGHPKENWLFTIAPTKLETK